MNDQRWISAIGAKVPAEIQAMGTPERWYAPSKKMEPTRLNTAIVTALVLTSIGLIVSAAALGTEAHDSGHSGSGLALTIALAMTGAALLCAAFWYASGNANNKQAYLFFPDSLVELFPTRHRIIAWSDIGMLRRTALSFHFPVKNGKPISFNRTMPNNRILARQIESHAVDGQKKMPTVTVVDTPSSVVKGPDRTTQLPHFTVHFAVEGGTAHAYSVSPIGEELLFLLVGPAVTPESLAALRDQSVHAGDAPGGTLGLTARASVMAQLKRYEEVQQHLRELATSDAQALLALQTKTPGSFFLAGSDIANASFGDPPTDSSYDATLALSHKKRGMMLLYLLSEQDLVEARSAIARLGVRRATRSIANDQAKQNS